MADPAVRALGAFAKGNVTVLNTVIPPAAQVGDLLVWMFICGSTTAPTYPSGWLNWRLGSTGGGSPIQAGVLAKTCVAGDPGASVPLTSGSNQRQVAVIMALSGWETVDGLDSIAPFANSTVATNSRTLASAVTQRRAQTFAMCGDRAVSSGPASTVFGYPPGWTELGHDRSGTATTGVDVSLSVAIGSLITAPNVTFGNGTWTTDQSNPRATSCVWGIRSANNVYPQLDLLDPNTVNAWYRVNVLGVGTGTRRIDAVTVL